MTAHWQTAARLTRYLYSVTSVGLVSPQRRRGRRCLPACAAVWPVPWCGLPSRGPAEVGTPGGSTGTAPCGRRFPSHPCRLCRTGRCRTEWRKLEGHSDEWSGGSDHLSVQATVSHLFLWFLCFAHYFTQSAHFINIILLASVLWNGQKLKRFCWNIRLLKVKVTYTNSTWGIVLKVSEIKCLQVSKIQFPYISLILDLHPVNVKCVWALTFPPLQSLRIDDDDAI